MKDITITIDDKIHKLTDDLVCSECSLYHLCEKLGYSYSCPANGRFVELRVEK
jgi:hypothetical protein